jgi:hypothetical protein
MSANGVPIRQISLEFEPSAVADEKPRKFRDSLSALEVADDGRTLFLGVDETVDTTPTIERLSWIGEGYAAHQALRVSDFLTLRDPTPKKGRVKEVDIEGLAVCDSFLWVVGSHSARRKKPKHGSAEEGIERLASVRLEPNRMLLGRIPLVPSAGGSSLAKRDGDRRSAQLVENLRDVLWDDPLLGPFVRTYENADGERVAVPGKDNGFDIEGIVVKPGSGGSSRVFLGLRGPVLRGWATIIEVAPIEGDKPSELVLGRVGDTGKRRYWKHVLQLEGLGIRDLRADGDDVLILAGPTMTLDGHVAIYRWVGALVGSSGDTLTYLESGRLEQVLTLHADMGRTDRKDSCGLLPESWSSFTMRRPIVDWLESTACSRTCLRSAPSEVAGYAAFRSSF